MHVSKEKYFCVFTLRYVVPELVMSSCSGFFFYKIKIKTQYLGAESHVDGEVSHTEPSRRVTSSVSSSGALKRTPVGKEATHHQYADVVKKWLRFAPFRQGGSGRRRCKPPVASADSEETD